MKKSKVKSILKILRNQLELYAKKYGFDSETLSCLCGISSYLVFLKLKELGYHPTICVNDFHSFVICDEYYIDLTIKQINKKLPKVYFSKIPYKNKDKFHKKQGKASNLEDIKKLFFGWPKKQNPYKVLKQLPEI